MLGLHTLEVYSTLAIGGGGVKIRVLGIHQNYKQMKNSITIITGMNKTMKSQSDTKK
jgi:hypothetical protein